MLTNTYVKVPALRDDVSKLKTNGYALVLLRTPKQTKRWNTSRGKVVDLPSFKTLSPFELQIRLPANDRNRH